MQRLFRQQQQRRLGMALMLALAVLPLAGSAHGPTRQKVVETIKIDAPPDQVWARVKDFGRFNEWHPAVQSVTVSNGNEVDSLRTIKLKGGGDIVEVLEAWSDAERKFSCRMKSPGPVPVSNYTATFSVKAGEAAGSTLVEWRGAFYRGYPNNDPPPDQNDDAAVAAITGIYKAGLDNLKALSEKR
jgi:carbon monoxide dehydrogenase subunit G